MCPVGKGFCSVLVSSLSWGLFPGDVRPRVNLGSGGPTLLELALWAEMAHCLARNPVKCTLFPVSLKRGSHKGNHITVSTEASLDAIDGNPECLVRRI